MVYDADADFHKPEGSLNLEEIVTSLDANSPRKCISDMIECKVKAKPGVRFHDDPNVVSRWQT
jgi:hypothetical protein